MGREVSAAFSIRRDDTSRTIDLQLTALGTSRIVKFELQNVPGSERKLALSYTGGAVDYGAILKYQAVNEPGTLVSTELLASVGRKVESGERYHNYLDIVRSFTATAPTYRVEAALPNVLVGFLLSGTSARVRAHQLIIHDILVCTNNRTCMYRCVDRSRAEEDRRWLRLPGDVEGGEPGVRAPVRDHCRLRIRRGDRRVAVEEDEERAAGGRRAQRVARAAAVELVREQRQPAHPRCHHLAAH